MASAELAAVELPQFKGRAGWEFTDISALDLAAYERALADESAGGVGAAVRAAGASELPEA